jgi:hypothetical protein
VRGGEGEGGEEEQEQKQEQEQPASTAVLCLTDSFPALVTICGRMVSGRLEWLIAVGAGFSRNRTKAVEQELELERTCVVGCREVREANLSYLYESCDHVR